MGLCLVSARERRGRAQRERGNRQDHRSMPRVLHHHEPPLGISDHIGEMPPLCQPAPVQNAWVGPDVACKLYSTEAPITMSKTCMMVAALLLATATAAMAGPPTDQVRRYTDLVQRILDDASMPPAEKRAAVRKIAEQVFDLTETAKRALGRHWQGRTPAEQEEFVQVFADLLERTYISKVEFYGCEQVLFTGEEVDGESAKARGKLVTTQSERVQE